MVEKAGHSKGMHRNRVDWINEGRPKTSVVDEGGDAEQQTEDSAPKQAPRIAPIFDKAASGRSKTPDFDTLFGEEDDIYNATPVGGRKSAAVAVAGGDEPDEDELDALMAMDQSSGPSNTTKLSDGPRKSLFGDGKSKTVPLAQEPDEFDDWEALMADAENEPPRQKAAQTPATTKEQPTKSGDAVDGDEDDLDALMAEVEAESAPANKPAETAASASKTTAAGFDDDEEAMAEMDGLW